MCVYISLSLSLCIYIYIYIALRAPETLPFGQQGRQHRDRDF